MPCSIHDHKPWPRSGTHVLRIEACETQCGWCGRETKAANNLRAHARCHVKNPNNAALSNITIYTGKAGRSRVSMPSETTFAPQSNDDIETRLSNLESQIQTLQADNERLNLALQRAQSENEKLRAAGTLTTTPLASNPANYEGFEEDCNRMAQKLLKRSEPSPRRRESFSSASENGRYADHAIQTGRQLMTEDQRPNVESTVTNDSSQSDSRPGDIHSGRDGLPQVAPASGLPLAMSLNESAKPVEPTLHDLRSHVSELEANSIKKNPTCCGIRHDTLREKRVHNKKVHAPKRSAAVPMHSVPWSVLHAQETNPTHHPRGSVLEWPMSTLDWDWANIDEMSGSGQNLPAVNWTAYAKWNGQPFVKNSVDDIARSPITSSN